MRPPAHDEAVPAIRCRPGGQAGFVYIGLMILVAVLGVFLALAGEVWQTVMKQEKEKELLFVGNQFRQALTMYYERSPANARRYPMTLEELLKDSRAPGTQRYLRKIYPDPITGGVHWGVVRGPNGEIFGVHSLSEEEPLKKGSFGRANKQFEGKTKYSDWVFMHSPGQSPSRPIRNGM